MDWSRNAVRLEPFNQGFRNADQVEQPSLELLELGNKSVEREILLAVKQWHLLIRRDGERSQSPEFAGEPLPLCKRASMVLVVQLKGRMKVLAKRVAYQFLKSGNLIVNEP